MAVRITLPPEQKVVEPPADIVGVVGRVLTVTEIGADASEVQPLAIACTVKLPVAEAVNVALVLPSLQK